MRTDLEIRAKAALKFVEQQMVTAFKTDFYDIERECFKTKAVAEFVSTLQEVRKATKADDDLASAMGNARIG